MTRLPRRFTSPTPFSLGAFSLALLAEALGACLAEPPPATGAGGSGMSAAGTPAGSGSTNETAGTNASGSSVGGTGAGSGGVPVATGGAGSSAGGSGGSAAGAPPEVSSDGDGDVMVGPSYPKDPNLTDLGNPRGKSFKFVLRSEDSQFFKGTESTLTKPAVLQNWERDVDVYVPAQYHDGDEAPILVMQEGQRPDSVGQLGPVSRALDNLTISNDPSKKLPAFIVIAIENGDDRDNADGKGSERGLEYDTVSDKYNRFVDSEVLPAVLANAQIKQAYPNLKLTQDPFGRATMGCSSGAAAAFTMGWFGTFGRVISYSGTLVAQQNESQPEAQMYPFGAWEYHSEMELIKHADKKPLRIFIHASENDNGSTQPESGHHNWLMANQRTAAALKDKGYHYRFVFSKSTGHCDGKVFDLTMAETLSWVWRGYPTP